MNANKKIKGNTSELESHKMLITKVNNALTFKFVN